MFDSAVQAIQAELIAWRRHIHQNPELSFLENSTTAFIIEQLRKLPALTLSTPTKTGVVATLRGTKPGRTIALRADIDALPIQEETPVPFASQNEGVMHACGHDGHTAMLLAAAKLLCDKREELCGEVRFFFQHAEEVPPGGAAELCAAGVMEGVEEVYGLHLSPLFDTGLFGVRSGAFTSATDRFDIRIIGKGGHSAYPEDTVDPIVIAAEVITSLQTLISRRISALEPAVVSVCQMRAGDAYNIIPGVATLTGSMRTFSEETRVRLEQEMSTLAKGIAEAHGGKAEFTFSRGYSSVYNDAKLTAIATDVIEKTFGAQAVLPVEPFMPGEDFSAFTNHCPGYFVDLGTRNERLGAVYPMHNARFLMDEDSLLYGVQYWVSLVMDRLSER